MARRAKEVTNAVSYQAEQVWAAAAYADRINGSTYESETRFEYDENGQVIGTIKANKIILAEALASGQTFSAEDFQEGRSARQQVQSLAFKVLAGQRLSDFLSKMLDCAQFETVKSTDRFVLGIIAYSITSARRLKEREAREQLLAFANSTHIGKVGERVTLPNVRIVKSIFSQQWNTFYITGLAEDQRVVWFALRKPLDLDSVVTVTGTVKRHAENGQTQLNRAKVS